MSPRELLALALFAIAAGTWFSAVLWPREPPPGDVRARGALPTDYRTR